MLLFIPAVLLLLCLAIVVLAYRTYGGEFNELNEADYKYKKFMFIGAYLANEVLHGAHLSWFPKSHLAVRQALSNIYGTRDLDERVELYYIHKLGVFLLVLMVFAFLSLFSGLSSTKPQSISEIDRPSYDESNQYKTFDVKIQLPEEDSIDRRVTVKVNKKPPTREQGQAIIVEEMDKIEQYMLADNSDFDHIVYPLRFPNHLYGSDFKIVWQLEEGSVFNDSGEIVGHDDLKADKSEKIIAKFYLEDEQYYSKRFKVTILTKEHGLNATEKIDLALDRFVDSAEKDSSKDSLVLPSWLVKENYSLEWIDGEADNLKFLKTLFMGLVIAGVVFFVFDSQLKDQTVKRKNQILIEFPGFVDRFVLLLNSGNSVNNALLMTLQNIEEQNPEKLNNPLYRELEITRYEIFEAGVSNVIAFENLGKRNQIQLVQTYATLIAQSVKKGDKNIAEALNGLVREAWLNKKNLAREAGSKASSKLLTPMMILLMAVFILAMVPAFLTLTKI